VNDLGIVEAADDMRDGVSGANVPEELVAETLALRRAFDQAGNVDELHGGGHQAFGMDELGDLREPLIRYGDDAGVGVDGAKG